MSNSKLVIFTKYFVLCIWYDISSRQYYILQYTYRAGDLVEKDLGGLVWMSLQWRHNQHEGVSNHQSHDCLFCANERKHLSFASLAFVRGIHRWPVNSPHKGPVTRKSFRLITSSWGRHCNLITNSHGGSSWTYTEQRYPWKQSLPLPFCAAKCCCTIRLSQIAKGTPMVGLISVQLISKVFHQNASCDHIIIFDMTLEDLVTACNMALA